MGGGNLLRPLHCSGGEGEGDIARRSCLWCDTSIKNVYTWCCAIIHTSVDSQTPIGDRVSVCVFCKQNSGSLDRFSPCAHSVCLGTCVCMPYIYPLCIQLGLSETFTCIILLILQLSLDYSNLDHPKSDCPDERFGQYFIANTHSHMRIKCPRVESFLCC